MPTGRWIQDIENTFIRISSNTHRAAAIRGKGKNMGLDDSELDVDKLSPEAALELYEEEQGLALGRSLPERDGEAAAEPAKPASGADADSGAPDGKKSVEPDAAEPPSGDAAKAPSGDKPASDKNPAEGEKDEPLSPVSTKDGKHVIPYEVLRQARDEAKSARAELDALKAKLETEKESGKPEAKQETADLTPKAQTESLTKEEIEALEEDYPVLAKALKSHQALIAETRKAIEGIQRPVEALETRRKASAEEEVQGAIDDVPKLAFLQAKDPERFTLACNLDAQLKDLPQWKGKPMKERFETVVRMVELNTSEISLPEDSSRSHPKNEDQPARQTDAKTAKAAAAPLSLSDFPSGMPAAENEADALDAMSATDLAREMAKHSAAGTLDQFLAGFDA
jgi:hypothetical protein